MRNALHKEITEDLRRKIESGEYKPGERLPTEPELEQHYGASRNTIRTAVGTLIHEGLIQQQPGRGMFVPAAGLIPFFVYLSKEEGGEQGTRFLDSYGSGVEAAGRTPSKRNWESRIEYPSNEVASLLEIDEDAQVVMRGAQRLIDDRPYSLQRSYYPLALVRGSEIEGRDSIARGTIRVLAELGHEQVGYRDELVPRMPTPEERDFFRIGPGIPVIVVYRLCFDRERTPIRLTITTYAADRNRPCYEIGEVPPRRTPSGQITTIG